MTREITRFDLSEVKNLRIKCLKCGAVIEIDAHGAKRVVNTVCPNCGSEMLSDKDASRVMLNLDNVFEQYPLLKDVAFEMEFKEKQ